MNTDNQCSQAEFKSAMRRLMGGVTIVCTKDDDKRYGMAATAVCSVTTAPPTLLACLNTFGSTCAAVTRSGIMSVNILHPEDVSIAKVFSRPSIGGQDDRFDVGEWDELATGAPVLQSGTASFDCKIDNVLDSGSHRIFIARVLAVNVGNENAALGYFDGRFVAPADIPNLQARG